jgi:hypothetical protein
MLSPEDAKTSSVGMFMWPVPKANWLLKHFKVTGDVRIYNLGEGGTLVNIYFLRPYLQAFCEFFNYLYTRSRYG